MKKISRLIMLILLLIFLAPQLSSANSSVFIWPADGNLTGYFGDPRSQGPHLGIDIGNRGYNIPVISTYEGRVVETGRKNSEGNYVNVQHNINGKNVVTKYFHLKEIHVTSGQSVSKGQRLGYMGNTGDSTGQHLHFEVHIDGVAQNPLKVLYGDYDHLFTQPRYNVYHSTNGLLKSFYSYEDAKAYSQAWNHTAVIRINDGKQLFANGLKSDNYTVFHSVHQALATFSIKQNAIDYSKKWQNTVVRDNGTRKQVYARQELGSPRYEVFHSSQGAIGEFHFDYLARGMMNYYQYTITIDKSTGKQIAQHPEANGPQFDVYHATQGKLTTFSFLSAAVRYSNNWQHTVVIDNVTKKEMYARDDLGEYRYVVKDINGNELAKFHYLNNAETFAAKYSSGSVIIESL